jgi:tryptophan-rich sensory protein
MTSNPVTSTVPPDAAPGPARRLDLLALFAILSLVTLGIGGWLTSLGFGPWYDELKKPPFQPPGWVFSPVWTTIFALLAIATWQIARRGAVARGALRLYAVQLVLNVAWSLLFFTLSRPAWGLAEIVVLDVVVVAMVVCYGRVHRAAGWMIVPYAVWLGLATAINVWIVMNN